MRRDTRRNSKGEREEKRVVKKREEGRQENRKQKEIRVVKQQDIEETR